MKKRSIPTALVALVIASLVSGVVAIRGSERLTGQISMPDSIDLQLVEVTPERVSAGTQSPGNDYGRYIYTIKNVGEVAYNLLNGGTRVRFKESGVNGYAVVQHIRGDMIVSGDAVIQPGNTTVVRMTAHTYTIASGVELTKTATFRVLEYPYGLDSVPANNNLTTTVTFPVIAAMCGNGVIEGEEICDDGNNEDGDFCSYRCNVGVNEHVRLIMANGSDHIELQEMYATLLHIYQENLENRIHGTPVQLAREIDVNKDGYLEDWEASLIWQSLSGTNPAIIDPLWRHYQELIDDTRPHYLDIRPYAFSNLALIFHESLVTGKCRFEDTCDINNDGVVNTEDFALFLEKIVMLLDFMDAHVDRTTEACIQR